MVLALNVVELGVHNKWDDVATITPTVVEDHACPDVCAGHFRGAQHLPSKNLNDDKCMLQNYTCFNLFNFK